MHPASTQGASTWDGGGNNNNWSTANNWNPDGDPVNGTATSLIFGGTTRLAPNMNNDWGISSLAFNSSAGNFVITSNDLLTLQAGVTNNSGGTQTLNVDIALGAAQTWQSTVAGGTLVIGTTRADRTLVNNGHTLTVGGPGNVLFNAQLSGTGGFVKNGTGTATLSDGGADSFSAYTGTTTVNSGTLIADLGNNTYSPLLGTITIAGGVMDTRWINQIGDSTAVNVLGAGTLRINASTRTTSLNETVGSLNVSGGSLVETVNGTSSTASIVLNGNLTHDGTGATAASINGNLSLGGATRTFAVANSSAADDLNVSATISSTGSINKTGAGTLTLGGNNTYTGTTALAAGTTVINGNQNAATGAVSVASGATLSGTGSIGGAATISGTHAPGGVSNGVGNQTFANGLTYASGSIFSWDLASNINSSGFDTVSGTGALNVNSNAIFRIVLGSGVDVATTFWDSARSWTSIFTGLTGGSFNASLLQLVNTAGNAVNTTGQGSFTISGTTLNWTAMPEPSSAVFGLLMGAGLLRRRRA